MLRQLNEHTVFKSWRGGIDCLVRRRLYGRWTKETIAHALTHEVYCFVLKLNDPIGDQAKTTTLKLR